MAQARSIPGLGTADSYAAAGAKVVSVRAEEVFDHAEDVLRLDDIERVHDMRVATRRLRAALEIFEPCFPRKQFKRTLREVKDVADALGERRDRDVAIDALGRFSTAMPSADRPGVENLIERFRAEQEQANETLRPLVSGQALERLRLHLSELLDGARSEAKGNGSAA